MSVLCVGLQGDGRRTADEVELGAAQRRKQLGQVCGEALAHRREGAAGPTLLHGGLQLRCRDEVRDVGVGRLGEREEGLHGALRDALHWCVGCIHCKLHAYCVVHCMVHYVGHLGEEAGRVERVVVGLEEVPHRVGHVPREMVEDKPRALVVSAALCELGHLRA